MSGQLISLHALGGLAHLLDVHGLQGDLMIEGGHARVRVHDSMGHTETHPIEDFLVNETECADCVLRIVEHFEKSRFHSQRGISPDKILG